MPVKQSHFLSNYVKFTIKNLPWNYDSKDVIYYLKLDRHSFLNKTLILWLEWSGRRNHCRPSLLSRNWRRRWRNGDLQLQTTGKWWESPLVSKNRAPLIFIFDTLKASLFSENLETGALNWIVFPLSEKTIGGFWKCFITGIII